MFRFSIINSCVKFEKGFANDLVPISFKETRILNENLRKNVNMYEKATKFRLNFRLIRVQCTNSGGIRSVTQP